MCVLFAGGAGTSCNLNRKRPLLGGPARSCMNPTKRTVMQLLARAKNAHALHGLRTRNGISIETYIILKIFFYIRKLTIYVFSADLFITN